jgi:hypothetical protein
MRKKLKLKQQGLADIRLTNAYLFEPFTAKVLGACDIDGNAVAVYGKQYHELANYCQVHFEKPLTALNLKERIDVLENIEARFVCYYSAKNLETLQLDTEASGFNREQDIVDISGNKLIKVGEQQNCIIMRDDKIYIHPKVISKSTDILDPEFSLSVGHGSLSRGKPVQFAGVFYFSTTHGWVLENASGHYAPRPYHLRKFIETLHHRGMNISQLTIKCMVPRYDETGTFDAFYHSAATLIKTTNLSLAAITKQTQQDESKPDSSGHASSGSIERASENYAPSPTRSFHQSG